MNPFYKDESVTIYHGDCLEVMPTLREQFDAIVVDPPYGGMVSEKWDSMTKEQSSAFFSSCLDLSYGLLRHGGRFVSFGSNDTLEFLFGSKLLHRELLVVDKDFKKVSAGRNTRRYKQHINATEYVFVATKYAREYCRQTLLKSSNGYTPKQINEKLGVASNGGGMWSIYTGENICNQVPTRQAWEKFSGIFPNLPKYDSFQETFNNEIGKGNILSGFDFYGFDRFHPTQKPLALMEYLVRTYTNEGDTVLDFTMGSGTTLLACKRTGRKCVGIEKELEYCEIAVKRLTECLL